MSFSLERVQLLNLLLTGAGTVANVVIDAVSSIFSGIVTALSFIIQDKKELN